MTKKKMKERRNLFGLIRSIFINSYKCKHIKILIFIIIQLHAWQRMRNEEFFFEFESLIETNKNCNLHR